MALLCGKLINRQFLSSICGVSSKMGAAQYASKICFKPFEQQSEVSYDDKNISLKRPMSPHLTIYAPQITSFSSITHRITGMVLSGYFIALGCGALVLPNDISHYINMIEGLSLSAPTLFATKFILALPFSYHLANGLRHLAWDTARGLTIDKIYTTAYIVFGATVAISAYLASL